MKAVVFKKKSNIIKFFMTLTDQIDFGRTMRVGRNSIVLLDGTIYRGKNLKQMLDSMNKVIGEEVFNIHSSRVRGIRAHMIVFTEGKERDTADFGRGTVHVEPKSPKVEDKVEASVENLDEDDEPEDVVEAVVEEDKVSTPTIQWDWINGLQNNKDDKKALKDYAANFDIELKGNMKLENLVAKFKEELENS